MNTVPRLDLAPKLKRPLQLWNPPDYLRLLYWCFFFPQAVRWYVETFAHLAYRKATGREVLPALRADPVLRNLVLQGMVLIVVVPLLLATCLQAIGVPVEWSRVAVGMVLYMTLYMVFSVMGGVVGGVALGVGIGVVCGVMFGVMFSVVAGIAGDVAFSMVFGVAFGVAVCGAMGVAFSVAASIEGGVAGRVVFSVAASVVYGVVFGVMFSVIFGKMFGIALGVAVGVVVGVVMSMAVSVMTLRPLDYLLSLLQWGLQRRIIIFSRTTALPLPGLRRRVENWLTADWEVGIHNVHHLLAYSLQFIPVVGAVNAALECLPDARLCEAIAALAHAPFDWNVLRFASASFYNAVLARFVSGLLIVAVYSKKLKQSIRHRFDLKPRLDTHARAACAGFWLLHEKTPNEAVAAFEVVRALPHGAELHTLARVLAVAQPVTEFAALASLAESNVWAALPPVAPRLLYPDLAEALHHLRRAALEAQTVQRSISRAARSQALNRALGEIEAVLTVRASLPEVVRDLIAEIAEQWRDACVAVAGEVGRLEIAGPVRNPYTLNDPVVGTGFVGREETLRELEALWANTDAPASVVLYGHRRMGKTSILRNLAGHLGARVHPAYLNLQILGDAPGGVGDVLLAIADAVARALQEAGCIPPAVDAAALASQPHRAFEHFLRETRRALEQDRLIIALDEFEEMEKWVAAGRIPRDFFKVLRSYVQLDPHIAFAFAGLHTLEEMSGNYFEPFFASVIPIRVAFLSRAATAQLLANPPGEDFPLDYTPAALERVWELTGGQPFLVQLIAHRLVSCFNDLTFERRQPPASQFTVEDVEAIIADAEFYTLGRYYFTGVWGQAEASPPPGQPAILTALTEGALSTGEIAVATGLAPEVVAAALKRLAAHDVVHERDGRWAFTVELMRRWVAARQATA